MNETCLLIPPIAEEEPISKLLSEVNHHHQQPLFRTAAPIMVEDGEVVHVEGGGADVQDAGGDQVQLAGGQGERETVEEVTEDQDRHRSENNDQKQEDSQTGAAVFIKDEIDVEESIILSDPEFDLPNGEDRGDEKMIILSDPEFDLSNKADGERKWEQNGKTGKLSTNECNLSKTPDKSCTTPQNPKESDVHLKNVLEKKWISSKKEQPVEEVVQSNDLEDDGNNLGDNDLQSLIKYLVTNKRPDKEAIKKIVSLTRTKLSKMEASEVDNMETKESMGKAKSKKVIAKAQEKEKGTLKTEQQRVFSKFHPSRAVSRKSASELKAEILETMKRNAEEQEEQETRRAGAKKRGRGIEQEEQETRWAGAKKRGRGIEQEEEHKVTSENF